MDLASFLTTLSIAAIPVVFAITLHEVAHGWVARNFGDRTAEAQGRLSFNPIRHIDPVGTILVPVLLLWLGGFLFGWAKPVPVNPRFLRDPRPHMALVAAAGPAANLAMALVWALVMFLSQGAGGGILGQWLTLMAAFGITINFILALLNLLPIPPLDGGQVLMNVLPPGPFVNLLERLQPFGLLIVLLMIPTGILAAILGGPMDFLQSLLINTLGVRGI
ncbi:MAG: site-2 protease family protein [Steroidobacteraceae bacterium]